MDRSDQLERFVRLLDEALRADRFVRLVISKPHQESDAAGRVTGRLVTLASGRHLSVTFHYATRDDTKNIPVSQAGAWLRDQVNAGFHNALLGATTRDWQLIVAEAGKARVVGHKPVTVVAPPRTHDQPKPTFLDDSADPWLQALKITRPKRQQIDRYLEIVLHLTAEVTVRTIADMGCGKGYLTFGLWHLLRHLPVHILGVEQRPDLVATGNQLARRIGATGLEFVAGTIQSVTLPALDALIALHACDTATDDAIRRGVEAGAKLIVVAPCCHKQVRAQLASPEPLAPVLKHGIMAGRMAEWATDGLRALHLEATGYRTKLFEFVASEHTPKNLMIAAIRTGQPGSRDQLDQFQKFFGIQQFALDGLGTH